MAEGKITNIEYRSGTTPNHPEWDVLQVISSSEGRTTNTALIARDTVGIIRQVIDVILDKWQAITNERDLRVAQSYFSEQDGLTAQRELRIWRPGAPPFGF